MLPTKAIVSSPVREISQTRIFRSNLCLTVLGGLGLIVCLTLALSAKVVAQQKTEPPAQLAAATNAKELADDKRYRIGPGDVLAVFVRKSPELSLDAVRVDQRGMIRLPMIDGDVSAACRTESELAVQITSLY